MLFSFLIASVSAGPTNTAGIDPVPINITNRCGVDGAMDHEFVVTLKPPPTNFNGRRLDTTQDKLSFLQGWVHQYDPEDTSNGTTRRKLEANSNSTQILHLFALTQLAVAISAGDDTIALMAKDPAVSSIEVDCLQRADMSLPESDDFSPGDPDMDQVEVVARRLSVQVGAPWGIDRIDTNGGATDNNYDDGDLTGKGVRVYIVDTGVQGSHDDFGGRVVNGHTALERDECASCQAVNGILPADGTGCKGHGTHVASTVGGLKYGVAKEVTIVPAFSCFKRRCNNGKYRCGSGVDIAANLEWVLTDCAAHPEARCVVQRSLSGGFLKEDAALLKANVLVVAAAGNSGESHCSRYYDPITTPDKLLVGSTTKLDKASSFSNYGACVHVQAPGSDILAAWVGSSNAATKTISGTSMAAPHVSGVAAQLLAGDSTLSVARVKEIILAAAEVDSIDLTAMAEAANTPNRFLIGGRMLIPFLTFLRPPSSPPPPLSPPPPSPPLSPPPLSPPGWDIIISGGCNDASGSAAALTYVMQGTTASGAPYYKADGVDYWLYWDPDCGGSGYTARWIFASSRAPSTTATSDLDGDGKCRYLARIYSDDSSSPPQGLATWRAYCSSAWTDTDVTTNQLAPPSPPSPPSPPLPPSSPSPLPPSPPPLPPMDWKWPADANVDCKDFHPRIGGGQEEVGGWDRGAWKLANACDSNGDGNSAFHTENGYGVNGDDYVDFIFTFDANTWCSGYRQSGSDFYSDWRAPTFTKDIEIYTGDANFGPWTEVATDSHSTWHNGATNTFPDDGTTTEWTPTAPSKYLLVRTRTNHGNTANGGRLTVRFLQLKLSTPPN